MPCPHSKRKHTPIASKKQRGLFGAELRRRRTGKASRMKGITTAELRSHLKESKGKKLPWKSRMSRVAKRARRKMQARKK